MNKKGSLNLSIQAIVIVVIAFIFLGLAIAFVQNQLGGAEDTFSSVQEQIKQQILDDLRRGNKKLSFPAQTIDIDKNGAKDVAIGVKNIESDPLDYLVKIEVEALQEQPGKTKDQLATEHVEFFYDKGSATLDATDSRVHGIKVSAPGPQGTYLVKLQVMRTADGVAQEGVAPYDQKTFFVNIR